MKIQISYSLEAPAKLIKDISTTARRLGYGYGDADTIEIVKRYLIDQGAERVFPNSHYDSDEMKLTFPG